MNSITIEKLDEFYKEKSSVSKGRDLTLASIFSLYNEERLWRYFNFVLYSLNLKNIGSFKILDAGCGDGRAINRLEEIGFSSKNCYGVDGSEYIIDYAKYKNSVSSFSHALLTDMPYKDGFFDMSLCLGVLNHMKSDDDVVNTMYEIHRVLRKDGLVFLTVPGKHVEYSDYVSDDLRTFNVEDGVLQDMISDRFDCIGMYAYSSPPSYYEVGDFNLDSFYKIENYLRDPKVYKGFYVLVLKAI